MSESTSYFKLGRQQLITLAIALEDQRDIALAKLAQAKAEIAYQQARAAYFRYAPDIDSDPEGVRELADEVLRLSRVMVTPSGNA